MAYPTRNTKTEQTALRAVSLSVGKDAGTYVSGSVILIYDANGTPLIGCEKQGDKLIIICSYEKPTEMQDFLSRHGIPGKIEAGQFKMV